MQSDVAELQMSMTLNVIARFSTRQQLTEEKIICCELKLYSSDFSAQEI